MAEFLFVHDAWHGAWCWDDLIPVLAVRGHGSHVLDLPGLGEDCTSLNQVTLDGYVSAVVDRIRRIDRPIWLVGHSMGGIPITQAADSFSCKVNGLVYVTAFLPIHGQSFAQLRMMDTDSHLNSAMVQNKEKATVSVAENRLREIFYTKCSDRSYRKALQNLTKEQAQAPLETPVALTGRLDTIPKYYIECLQDQALSIAAQRQMHSAAKVDRVASLDSDHSPFLSCPDQLAGLLHEVTVANFR